MSSFFSNSFKLKMILRNILSQFFIAKPQNNLTCIAIYTVHCDGYSAVIVVAMF